MSVRQALPMILRFTVGLVALVVLVRIVDAQSVGKRLANADVMLTAFGIVAMFASVVIASWRWQGLLRDQGRSVGMYRLVELNLISLFYGTILPGQIAGEAVKTARLVRGQTGRSDLAASVAVDKIVGLVGLLLVGLGALAVAEDVASHTRAAAAVLLASTLTCAVGVICIASWLGSRQKGTVALSHSLRRRVVQLFVSLNEAIHRYATSYGRLSIGVAQSVVVQIILTLEVLVLARAIDLSLSIIDATWVFAVVGIVQLLPITFAGLGTREGAFLFLFGGLGVSNTDAVTLSMLVLLATTVCGVVGGILELKPRTARGSSSIRAGQIENGQG